MFKWLKKKKLMPVKLSPLAQEVKEALEEDEWAADEYQIMHKKSGMTLWVSNKTPDYRFFHIYRLPSIIRNNPAYDAPSEEKLKALLTPDERVLLGEMAWQLHQRLQGSLSDKLLNALMLARQTDSLNP